MAHVTPAAAAPESPRGDAVPSVEDVKAAAQKVVDKFGIKDAMELCRAILVSEAGTKLIKEIAPENRAACIVGFEGLLK